MKKVIFIFLTIILSALLFWGCQKKKNNPPSIPPAESMTIDFSNFLTSNKSGITDFQTKGNDAAGNTNWSRAAGIAGFWNILLSVNIAVPVASFKLAASSTPVYVDNNTWEWHYSVSVLGSTYNARLTGQIESNDVKWLMYISRDGVGSFEEFLWFNGTAALDGKSGQWLLYYSYIFQEPMLQIDWTLNGSNIGSVKYTYVRDKKDDRTTDPYKTSYIEYGLTTNTLNAYYNVCINPTGVLNDFKSVKIEWSTSLHNGHIKSEYYFGDSSWHCWDGSGNDVTCN